MTDHEKQLVRSACAGDRAAFEELVRRTSRLVFSRLYLETGDRDRAEDLVQETMLTAYRTLAGLTDPKSFRTWLLTIAQNTAIDAARRDRRKKRAMPAGATTQALDGVAGNGPRPDELVEQADLRDRVLATLRSLPEEYRLPLTLRYIAEADYETMCSELGLSNGSLRGLLHRGLKMLRNKLGHTFDERE